MHPIIRNVLAVIGGIFIGGVVNYALVVIGPSIIPLPAGVDPSDMESMNSNMHLYEAKHFIVPIVAHALGTLVGAFIAAKIAASYNLYIGLGIAVFFLLGGIAAVSMLDAPMWVNVTDLLLAYIPMGWLGWKSAGAKR